MDKDAAVVTSVNPAYEHGHEKGIQVEMEETN